MGEVSIVISELLFLILQASDVIGELLILVLKASVVISELLFLILKASVVISESIGALLDLVFFASDEPFDVVFFASDEPFDVVFFASDEPFDFVSFVNHVIHELCGFVPFAFDQIEAFEELLDASVTIVILGQLADSGGRHCLFSFGKGIDGTYTNSEILCRTASSEMGHICSDISLNPPPPLSTKYLSKSSCNCCTFCE